MKYSLKTPGKLLEFFSQTSVGTLPGSQCTAWLIGLPQGMWGRGSHGWGAWQTTSHADADATAAVCEQRTCETCARARYRTIYGHHDIIRSMNPRSISRYRVIDMITTLDSTLSFDKHVNVTRCCHYHILALRHIWPLLTLDTAKAMVVATVGSRLDYCNSVLYGMSQVNINRLQRVQNILAWVVARAPWTVSSLDICRDLHWLLVSHHITLLTWKTLHTAHPSYLSELITDYLPPRALRSSNTNFLARSTGITSNFASRAFSVNAPSTRNSLPTHIRSLDNLWSFKCQLKSRLF